MTKLRKTSVQLNPEMSSAMETWPGLTRSEAIRLSIERMHYVSTLDAEKISSIAFTFELILGPALEDFGYEDFRAVARALPAIVAGFVREHPNRIWKTDEPARELDPNELIDELESLHQVGRIGILDSVVAHRNTPQSQLSSKSVELNQRPSERGR